MPPANTCLYFPNRQTIRQDQIPPSHHCSTKTIYSHHPASKPTPRAHKNVEVEEWGLDIDKSAQSSPLAPNGLLVVLVVVVVVRVGWFDPVESNYFPGDTRFLFPTPSFPLVTSLAHYVFHLRGGYASKSFRLVRHPPPPIITDETLGGQGMAWDEVKRNLSSSSWVG